MQGGDDTETPPSGLPAPDLDQLLAEVGAAPDAPPPAAPDPSSAASSAGSTRAVGPQLPHSEARTPEPIVTAGTQPVRGAATWYRTDQERNKSVQRRANPWYRRLARGVVGLTFLAAAAAGLYLGARELQDWLDRDRLPAAGPEIPTIRATSFQIRSTSPAPVVDGTLTLDTVTGAFEFVGRVGGPQAGLQVVRPEGAATFVRQGSGPWQTADIDRVASQVLVTVDYLIDDDTADAILTNRLRRGYAELRRQEDEGVGDERLTRYEMEIDTLDFSEDFPLQWNDFRRAAVPGVSQAPALPATIWLDDEDVLVRVRIGVPDSPFWSWQRLAYSDQPFTPVDPSTDADAGVVDVALGLLPCTPQSGVGFFTELETCAEAVAAGRDLAVANGLATADDPDAADVAFTTVCRAIQNDDAVRTALLPASVDLAGELDAGGVCPGDLSRLESGDS